ncbi:glycosyltransferase family 28 protein [Ancylostoma ceylanicum]|uniref:UDP-N-acetylglucosamine transferase subunit ALG13 n=1 Tax=Ancylostoma ceylanicum TaxID=53326 RepID=A0A0D6LCB1_9BILA|nr:glycosyltransferase family 28 protein [Ancylostoma ceylanicum]
MTCFVTVGSTRFDELANEVLSNASASALRAVGVRRIKIQLGAGEWNDDVRERVFNGVVAAEGIGEAAGIPVEYYRYKPCIREDMEEAMLIIGHAGAGTCLESLKLARPFIVVVNENLMDNHQLELAKELARDEHLLYCAVSQLHSTLSSQLLFSLKPYSPPNQSAVARFIDRRMGLTSS